MREKKKKENRTKEEMIRDLQKKKIVNRMNELKKLEDKLGCVFVPMMQYTQTGIQTYIAPLDAPKEESKPKQKS